MIFKKIEDLIGNTPLLLVPPNVHRIPGLELYAKLEYMNPFGSLKDRVALSMLKPVLSDLTINKQTILEASSGNTAKALCAIAGTHGLRFKAVTNRIKTPEVRMVLQSLGAEIEELPGLSDCPDPLDPNDFTAVATRMAAQEPDKYFYTDQFFNPLNIAAHYETTGQEIIDDLGKVDHYFGFLGTCGSAMGVGNRLRERNSETAIWGVVASAGHHVPGGRNATELWESGFFRKDFFSGLVEGTRDEAISGMLELNRKVGMLCGPTSGLTYIAALKKLRELRSSTEHPIKAVFIACDRIEPYMSYLKTYSPEIFNSSNSTQVRVNNLHEEELLESKHIDCSELKEWLAGGAIAIDIRGNFAFSRGHIPNSINILDELLTQIIEEGPVFPQGRRICILCSVGTISRKFAAFLAHQGYQAASLMGGVSAWKRSKMELSISPASLSSDKVASWS